MKIVPAAILKDDSCNVGIDKMEITYTQNADTDSAREDIQFLKISAISAIVDDEDVINGQEAYYYRIQTDKWSINKGEDLMLLVDDFRKRLNQINEYKEKKDELQ